MRIVCKNGFYKFYPASVKELYFLAEYLNATLIKDGDYYTFAHLAALRDYTFTGWNYGGALTTNSFAGDKEDIFKANGFVYNYSKNTVELYFPYVGMIDVDKGAFISAKVMPQAYFLDPDTMQRITGFLGYFDFDYNMFMIEELYYD